MLQNYLKIALRFMMRQKGFSVINLSGLTIGVTCSLLIVLFIQDELSYENFHRDRDRTYRLGFRGKLEGKELNSAQTGTPVSKALQKDIPQIESTLRIASWATFPVRYEDKAYTEEKMLLADSNFFHFFTFRLLQGHPDSVLNRSGKIVITQSAARKYFGYEGKGASPVGKVLMLAQGYPVTISGIAADPPKNSHFRFTMVLSLNTWVDVHTGDWITGRVLTYFKVKPGESIDTINQALPGFIQTHLRRELHQLRNMSMAEFKSRGNDLGFFSQPLASIHLRSQLSDEMEANSNIQYVFIFGSVAVLMTLLACINFMNLSTARSATRAKEIGVRKSVGAQYHRLILQFLFESYFYVISAVLLSLFLVIVFLPVLNIATAKEIRVVELFKPHFIAGAVAFTILVGLLAGSYPAFYLTHFNPVEVLKGQLRAKLRSYGIRNALVVIQFIISTVLIIATMIIYLQLQFVQQASIGFDKSNILNLLHTKNLEKNGRDFKRDLLQFPGISSASYSNRLPPNVEWKAVFRETDSTREYFMSVYEMDVDHLETMRYAMTEGRFFKSQADTMSIILNETAAKALHMEDFEGRTMETNYDHDGRKRKVIGIMRDFNFLSFREPVQPLAVVLGPEPNWEMAIRITRGNVSDKVSLIESFWKKYAPNAPFEYTFLDKNFVAKHHAEQRLGTLSAVFSGLVIFIACIGLFGLAAFTADQRTKEIGIRKVMGASVNDIVIMINKDFLRPVIFANIVAWPLAGWLMYIWIRQFAYHISFPWWVFVLATLLSLIIAFVSVSLQSRKAAIGNPVDSLRNE